MEDEECTHREHARVHMHELADKVVVGVADELGGAILRLRVDERDVPARQGLDPLLELLRKHDALLVDEAGVPNLREEDLAHGAVLGGDLVVLVVRGLELGEPEVVVDLLDLLARACRGVVAHPQLRIEMHREAEAVEVVHLDLGRHVLHLVAQWHAGKASAVGHPL